MLHYTRLERLERDTNYELSPFISYEENAIPFSECGMPNRLETSFVIRLTKFGSRASRLIEGLEV